MIRAIRRVWGAALVSTFVSLAPSVVGAQERPVTLAGVAYSGDLASAKDRFKYSYRYEQELKSGNDSPYKRVLAAINQAPSQSLTVTANPIEELKGRDQALVVTLVLNSETVSVEKFGETRKLFVLVRGQTMFFDFKSMTVVRSYPLSFAYIDNFNHQPTDNEIMARVRMVYEGAGATPGIYGRFAASIAGATAVRQTPRFLQVVKVTLGADMVNGLPDYLKSSPAVYETWAADMVAEAISTRVGVPIVPYSKGYAIGNVMSVQVLDGDVYNLTLPKPDYEITVDLKGVKKVKYSQSGAGASYIYGSFADIRIEQPLMGKVYLNTAVKNAEVKIVPASQTYVDDFPAYYDSLNGMFVKLADAISGKGGPWLKTAAAAPDIDAQILMTKELMNLCK